MKLWHDDIRKPPDESWEWVRTNEQAKEALSAFPNVAEISLDHDLGLHEVDPDADIETYAWAGRSPDGSGYDLVCWMIKHGHVPPRVTIHSWNPAGAKRMASAFHYAGYDCLVSPFIPSKYLL